MQKRWEVLVRGSGKLWETCESTVRGSGKVRKRWEVTVSGSGKLWETCESTVRGSGKLWETCEIQLGAIGSGLKKMLSFSWGEWKS